MNFFSHRIRKINLVLVLIILLFLIYLTGLFTPLKNIARAIFSPIQKNIYHFAVTTGNLSDTLFFNFKKHSDILKENVYLTEKLEYYKIENAELEILRNENNELKKILNFAESAKFNCVPGNIIGRSEGLSNVLIIDRGMQDGLAPGLAAINSKGSIIGKIISCDASICEVLLLNDNQSRIAGTILNYQGTNGVIEGEYGLSMKMNLIPQDIEIKENDIIITSGLEKDIPYGLIIGEVNSVESKKGDLFQAANVQPLSPLDSSHIVAIILPEKE